MTILNERIKEMRQLRGFTLSYVADKLGVKEATMQRYESGEIKNIKHEYIVKLSKIFNCSPSYLMGWENIDYTINTDSDEYVLVETYNSLPRSSQARLLKYASSLANLTKLEEPILNAAHARTDITIPEDADISESDIMDDENF